MIAVSSLLAGKYDEYSRLFIEIPFLPCQPDLHTAPGGRYLKAFHKGSFDRLPGRYEEIFAFAEAHGLTLHEFSYETGINENVVDQIEDYIVQIETPVKG